MVLLVTLVLFASLSCYSCHVAPMRVDPLMKTDINLIGADKSQMSTYKSNNVVVNTNKMIAQAALTNSAPDIEEDLEDPFITTGSGKPRPIFKQGQEASEWVDDLPETFVSNQKSPLSRVKRCGGGDDDDGDANRARRAARRRASRRRAARRRAAKVRKERKAARKAAKKASKTETTVTTKVIKNGQVVSETTGAQPAVNSSVTTTTTQQQPAATNTVATQTAQAA